MTEKKPGFFKKIMGPWVSKIHPELDKFSTETEREIRMSKSISELAAIRDKIMQFQHQHPEIKFADGATNEHTIYFLFDFIDKRIKEVQ